MNDLATTVDAIYSGRLTLMQPASGYRFGSDAMLLAASVQGKPGQNLLEMGSGVGAVILAVASAWPKLSLTGLEREAAYFTCAQHNIQHNRLESQVTFIHGDVTDKALFKRLGSFDHVFSNPPYFSASGTVAGNSLRRVARQQDDTNGGLVAWVQAANRFLRPKGHLTLIYPTQQLHDLLMEIGRFAGDIRVLPLWPQNGEAAKRVLVRATKGSAAPLTLLPGLILHETDGTMTERAKRMINGDERLDW